ncbi:hypothetical protein SAMN05444487_114101 [Marininema mesophilum]|uniref:Uncharacterized protein n=1 Tax=Marininema mesophilum TaxID=1048340 RepID=A0A1H3AYD5_9BACL|nr:DUF6518 family protein [Marininema mesophilum]SDX34421.1 hypothetical protein SAMN05444487_114101 [Marininema mesophilum]
MGNISDKLKAMKQVEYLLFSFFIGIIIGILTILGQGVLPEYWDSLANSGSVWLLPAFFTGSLGSSNLKSIISSILTLLGMVVGYYGYGMLIKHVPYSTAFISLWTVMALIGGAIIGLAGFYWRNDGHPMHKFGSSLIGGVFISEGLTTFIHFNDYSHMMNVGIVQIIFGLVLIYWLEKRDRISCYKALMPILILGITIYELLHSINFLLMIR